MKHGSVLKEAYSQQTKSAAKTVGQQQAPGLNQYRSCIYWMLVGLLVGVIALLPAVAMYLKENVSTTGTTTTATTGTTATTTSSTSATTSTTTSSTTSTTTTTTSSTTTTATTTTSDTTSTTTTTTSSTSSTSTDTTSTSTSSTSTTTATVAPPCPPQSASGGILYSITNPSSSNYPTYNCYAYNWIATGTSATLSFFYRHDPGGWMLDDVNVYHGTTQLIINGGFETGNLNGWTYSGSCNVYIGMAYSGSSYAKSGNYYYYDQCSHYGDTISQTFTTVPGDQYTISFWQTNYLCCTTTEIANITVT